MNLPPIMSNDLYFLILPYTYTYSDYCNVIGLNDDLVPAVLAGM